jgi:SAM-dependent methyltransferase
MQASPSAQGSDYYDGLNHKLLEAIPTAARNVIEFGCAHGRLGEAFKRRCAQARWTGVDISPDALAQARLRLDAVLPVDLNDPDERALGAGFDTVVFGDVLEHLREPARFLDLAARITAPAARLACCVPNMAHFSVMGRLLAGDLSYDDAGLLDRTHLRFLTVASTFKMLLDAGWLPNVADAYFVGDPGSNAVRTLAAAAVPLGIPLKTAVRTLLAYQWIIDAIKSPPPIPGSGVPFSVVVAVNNVEQFQLNVARSPGLAEVGADIIPVQGARSAAEALHAGRVRARHRWILFCHQDVYVPRGAGHALAAALAQIPGDSAADTLIGFAGVAQAERGDTRHAGLVIDRIQRFDFPGARQALSMDEFAVALTRDSWHEIDASLGWHLWATDLCLAAARHAARRCQIARVPLFHNSYNDGTLSPPFHASSRLLIAKHPERTPIATLCGALR